MAKGNIKSRIEAEMFYFGLVKYLVSECMAGREVYLPELGTFKIKNHQVSAHLLNALVKIDQIGYSKPFVKKKLKFSVKRSLDIYINNKL